MRRRFVVFILLVTAFWLSGGEKSEASSLHCLPKVLCTLQREVGSLFLSEQQKGFLQGLQEVGLLKFTDSKFGHGYRCTIEPNKSLNSLYKKNELKMFCVKGDEVHKINAQMKKNGFSFQFGNNVASTSVLVATLLNLSGKFKASKCWVDLSEQIFYKGRYYPTVKKESFDRYWSKGHKNIVVSLDTTSGDKLFMTIADKPKNELDLLEFVRRVNESKVRVIKDDGLFLLVDICDELFFPMVDLRHKPEDAQVLLNMRVGDAYGLETIGQETIFQMDENGYSAKSLVAAKAVFRGGGEEKKIKKVRIDKPFVAWVERKGHVIFAVYCDETSWRDPEIEVKKDGNILETC